MFSKISLFFVVIALLCCFTGSAFAEESTDLSNDKYVEAVATMKDYSETLGWHGWLTILVLVATIAVLVSEKLPPDIVMLMGSGVLLFGGILTPTEFLTGFSKDVIFTLAMLFIIARALDTHGVISYLANKMFTKSKSYAKQLFSLMAPLSVGSAFLNNTPIVLMLTPVVRKWALDKKKYPSQFLIPLSYAAILGGSCTLIGTSSNLVVDGLLRAENPAAGFGFFELAKIGIPCVIVGIIYMMTFGRRLLPKRRDPTKNIAQEVKNFTGEFSVTKTCPLIAMTIAAASPQYFSGELLIEIERDGDIIASPGADEVIHDGDRLVFAGEICDIAKLHSIEGLNSLVDPHFTLDISSSHFSEVVISNTSSWIGKTLRKVRFRTYYGGSVLAIYREGKRVVGTVRGTKLRAGDVLIMLSNKPWPQDFDYNNDFFYIRHTEKLPLRVSRRAWWVFGVLVAMIMAATSGVPMFFASICAVVALTATKSIAIHEIRKSIKWSVLILIGSAFAFGTALAKTGVAYHIAKGILPIVHGNQYALIAAIFFITMFITELITNNAAALLLFPIAIQLARQAGFDSIEAMKAVGVTVALASSYSFCTPIGYQTNTIIYGPGGYKFFDYTKAGITLSIAVYILAVTLIPQLWPLH